MAKDLYLCSQLSAELDIRMNSLRQKVNIKDYIKQPQKQMAFAVVKLQGYLIT